MFDFGVYLVDVSWIQVRRVLTVESEPPSSAGPDHDRLAR
jgi:hypothetical protein